MLDVFKFLVGSCQHGTFFLNFPIKLLFFKKGEKTTYVIRKIISNQHIARYYSYFDFRSLY